MAQVWIIDFDDSFTYNIASEFYRQGLESKIIHWKDWTAPTTRLPKLLVLGPGPGHPDEYPVEDVLMNWWKSEVPMAGICLGHQLIARFLGLRVERSKRPVHGESVALKVPQWWQEKLKLPSLVEVQRYNSLGVQARKLPRDWSGWEEDGEWIALSHARALTYQFHPESVGTSCPEAFFLPLCRLAL
ncbi:MAG: aminodeoxychorismate/anthranilate synthase component II [Bacteriovoracaceae bacterium]|nr:aminodeoxychorismate/anthranilate synthase component II [Bacteriovoracaceae bacterium]